MRISLKTPSKPPVVLTPGHFRPEVGRIITCLAEEWPGQEIVITRGAEYVSGGSANSRHMKSQAFDFRTFNLLKNVDREQLLERVMARLGPGYYGYYGNRDGVRWYHIQWNGGTK